MQKVNSDAKKLLEFRKKFWEKVRKIKRSKPEIPMSTFFKETDTRNKDNFELLAKGGIDFQVSKVCKAAKVFGCTVSELLEGL